MKEAGEILRKARESKNLSLHEIGMSLKINPKTLQAIEAGDESKLPPKTFLRGFIKSYAQFLKLDVNEVLRASQEVTIVQVPGEASATETATNIEASTNTSATTQTPTPVTPKPTPVAMPKVATPERNNNKFDKANTLDNLKSQAVTPRRKMMIGLIIVMIIAIALVARLVNKYQRERVPEHSKEAQTTPVVPAEPTAQAPVAEANPAGPVNATAPGVTTAPPAEIMTPAPVTTPAVSAAKPEPTPEVKPTPKAEVKPEAAKAEPKPVAKAEVKPEQKTAPKSEAKPDATVATSAASDDTPVVENTKPQEVIVEALNNVTINYILGDGKPGSITLVPDQIHTFKSKQIQLEISDGGAVSIIVNGRERGVPGKIGKAMTLNYPK